MAAWLARAALTKNGKTAEAGHKLFYMLRHSADADERHAAELVQRQQSDLTSVPRWLIAKAMSSTEASAPAEHLFRQMLRSHDSPERTAAEGAIRCNAEAGRVANWLASFVLNPTKKALDVAAAKTGLRHMIDDAVEDERRTAEHALIWMVLHTRPSKCLSHAQRRSLQSAPSEAGTDWAALMLDKDVIRPLLKQGRWWHRCRLAERKFGFDFADEGINFVWERIEKYRVAGGDFRDWVGTVLGNYWNSLHRKWKRTVPKDSDTAKELESLADDDGQPWRKGAADVEVHHAAQSLPTSRLNVANTSGEHTLLPGSDLRVISGWLPIDGVLMGFETGLWRRIPPDLWNGWLDRLKISRWRLDDAIRNMKPPQRRELLAKLTGEKRNTLAKRWQRLKPAVAGLQCVATLLTAADDAR